MNKNKLHLAGMVASVVAVIFVAGATVQSIVDRRLWKRRSNELRESIENKAAFAIQTVAQEYRDKGRETGDVTYKTIAAELQIKADSLKK